MNCETYRNHILLRDSGELRTAQVKALESHLATCEDCRAFAADTGDITRLYRAQQLEAEPGEPTLERIRAAAGRHVPAANPSARRPGRHAPVSPWQQWRPAILYAAAAVLVLFIGITALRKQPSAPITQAPGRAPVRPATGDAELYAWAPQLDEQLDEVYELLGMVSDDLEPEDDIASDLIELEGWSI